MHINLQTFRTLLRQKGLTQTALAQKSKISAKTIGRIVRGEELRGSNAEKIARALDTTVEELQAPPSSDLMKGAEKKSDLQRLVSDLHGNALNALTLASLRYNVPEKAIIEVAPYLFSILAELSLHRRRKQADAWKDAALKAIAEGPERHLVPSIESIQDSIWDLYGDELASIERRELSGAFTGLHSSERGAENGHAFLEMLGELGAESGNEVLFYEASSEDMAPGNCSALERTASDFLDPEGEYQEEWRHEGAFFAIAHGTVLLRNMPKALFESGSGADRVAWIVSQPAYRDEASSEGDLAETNEVLELMDPNQETDGGKDA